MANLKVKDADGVNKFLKTSESGTDADPHIPEQKISSVTIPSTIVHGQKTVTTAGTDVVLAGSNALVIGVTVKALAGNTGLIYVGLTGVTSSTGFELSAGEQIFIPITNTNVIFIDSSIDAQSVSFIGN